MNPDVPLCDNCGRDHGAYLAEIDGFPRPGAVFYFRAVTQIDGTICYFRHEIYIELRAA